MLFRKITSNRIQTLFQGKDMKETFASSWLNQILALVRYSSTIHFFFKLQNVNYKQNYIQKKYKTKTTPEKNILLKLNFDCRNKTLTQRKTFPYSELFWSAFCGIRTEYGETRSISPYLVRMRENADENNSEYGNFTQWKVGTFKTSTYF